MQGIILAAGYGTRLGPLGEKTPKALLPVKGRPVINYLLAQLAAIGITQILLVTNDRFHGAFLDWLDLAGDALPLPVTIINDGTTAPENRLGAVRDIALALDNLPEPCDVFVSASDNLYTGDLSCLLQRFHEKKDPVAALIKQTDPAVLTRSGVGQVDDTGRLIAFVEKPKQPPSQLAAAPLYVYPADIRRDIDIFLADDSQNHDAPGYLVSFLVSQRTVWGEVLGGVRHDIGNLESYRWICDHFEES